MSSKYFLGATNLKTIHNTGDILFMCVRQFECSKVVKWINMGFVEGWKQSLFLCGNEYFFIFWVPKGCNFTTCDRGIEMGEGWGKFRERVHMSLFFFFWGHIRVIFFYLICKMAREAGRQERCTLQMLNSQKYCVLLQVQVFQQFFCNKFLYIAMYKLINFKKP